MASIVDDRGFNQGYVPSAALAVRRLRRGQAILERVSRSESSVILEVGCGTGELAQILAVGTRGKVVGGDVCRPFLEQAAASFSRPNLSFEFFDLMDEADGKWAGRQFDAIVGDGILHHLYPRLDSVLARFHERLKPGGRLVFWEPNLYNPYVFLIFQIGFLRKIAKLEPDEMAFTPREILKRLRAAGFSPAEARCRDFLVPNMPAPLIPAAVRLGAVLEAIPGVRRLAQSLFIVAEKAGH